MDVRHEQGREAAARLKSSRYQRRASTYLSALAVGMLLATIGFSALSIARIQTRSVDNGNDWTEAGVLAFSATEYGLALINRTSNWRTVYQGHLEIGKQSLGNGSMSMWLADEDDGDVSDEPTEPVRLYGIGRVGEAVRVHSVLIQPNTGLDVLRMAIHAGTELQVKGGKELMLGGVPASANGNMRNDEIIYGDTVSLTTSGGGVTTGNATITAAREMPSSGVFDLYRSRAIEIPYSGNIVGKVLGPGHNPWGAANEDGLYYIDTNGSDLEIEGCRINGTLVVSAVGKKVRLKDVGFLHNYRSDYPVLMVDGGLEIKLKTESMNLLEADWLSNFNPAGAPYEGASDGDFSDAYPNEIHGLVHATGQIDIFETSRIRGMVLGGDRIEIEGAVHIIHDDSLYENPPLGYTDPASPMAIVPDSWRWDKLPG